jgi:hypothetical protein
MDCGNGESPAAERLDSQLSQAVLGAAAGLADAALPLAARAPHVSALLARAPFAGAAAEALLQAGVRGVVDACQAIMAAGSTPAALKLQAADLLAAVCAESR